MRLPNYYLVVAFAAASQPVELAQKVCNLYILPQPTKEEYNQIQSALPKSFTTKILEGLEIYEGYNYVLLQFEDTKKKIDIRAADSFSKAMRILSDMPLRRKIEGLFIYGESPTSIYKTLRKGNSWLDVKILKLYYHYFFNLEILEPSSLIELLSFLKNESKGILDYRKIYLEDSPAAAKWRLGIDETLDIREMIDKMEYNALHRLNILLSADDISRNHSEALKATAATLSLVEQLKEAYQPNVPEEDIISRLRDKAQVVAIKYERKPINVLEAEYEEPNNKKANHN